MFEEQSFNQSVLKKLTEELPQTKKVQRRFKVLVGKSFQVLEHCICPCVIYFTEHLSKGFKIN